MYLFLNGHPLTILLLIEQLVCAIDGVATNHIINEYYSNKYQQIIMNVHFMSLPVVMSPLHSLTV